MSDSEAPNTDQPNDSAEQAEDFQVQRTQLIDVNEVASAAPPPPLSAPPPPPPAAPTSLPRPTESEVVEDDDEGYMAAAASEQEPMPEMSLGRAHECLEIRTPVEEFETYVRARIDTLTRLGERDKVELSLKALELGRRKLARLTGSNS